jgi:hypothetical protein
MPVFPEAGRWGLRVVAPPVSRPSPAEREAPAGLTMPERLLAASTARKSTESHSHVRLFMVVSFLLVEMRSQKRELRNEK